MIEPAKGKRCFEITSSNEIQLNTSSRSFKFNRVFLEESQDTIYDAVLKDESSNDSTLLTIGTSPVTAAARLLTVFFKDSNQMGFQDLKKSVPYLKGQEGFSAESGTRAATVSVFEINNNAIKDLYSNAIIKGKGSVDIGVSARDKKIKPSGISEVFITDLESGETLIRDSLHRKSPASHCILYLNFYTQDGETVKSSRYTVAELGEVKTRGAELVEFSRAVDQMKRGAVDRNILRNNKLAKLLFSQKSQHFATLVVLNAGKQESAISHLLRLCGASSSRVVSQPASKSLKRNRDDPKDEIKRLKVAFEKHQEEIITTELRVRKEVTERYEAELNKMSRDMREREFSLQDDNDRAKDCEVEKVSLFYKEKVTDLEEQLQKVQADLVESENVLKCTQDELETLKCTQSELEALRRGEDEEIDKLKCEKSQFEKDLGLLKEEKALLLKSQSQLQSSLQTMEIEMNLLRNSKPSPERSKNLSRMVFKDKEQSETSLKLTPIKLNYDGVNDENRDPSVSPTRKMLRKKKAVTFEESDDSELM